MVEQSNQGIADFATDDAQIEKWKVKRLIKSLDEAKGNGTSVVSLYIPPKEPIMKTISFLNSEFAGAASIKSAQTRKSVQSAIEATANKLKLYRATPENGLYVFCGVVFNDTGKDEKKILFDNSPHKPLPTFCYRCQPTFHTDPLLKLLQDDEKFGFIIVDGNGVLFATLQGSQKETLQKMNMDLPTKTRKGGQSSVRFARLREEKKQAYITKVCELSAHHFISDNRPNVKGIILAGCASIKTEVGGSEKFDKRMKEVVLGTFDVSYGFENGFNQAITEAADCLKDVKFVQEKKIIGKFYEEIAQDTGKVVFGVDDTLKAMEMGSLNHMILFEDIEVMRYELQMPDKEEKRVKYLNEAQQKNPKHFQDPETGAQLEIVDQQTLADWLLLYYGKFGIKIELVTDQSSESFQFVKGFGGIGGFLRYKLELDDIIGDAAGQYDDFDPDEDFI